MQPLFICLTLGRRGWGSLVMQMAVCLWHPVIMLYLCPMPFRRKSSGGQLVSCSLTVHWLHRPGRLLEARVMKADVVSCLGAKAHGYVLRPRQGVGLRGIPFPQNSASGFWSVAPPSRPVACPSSRWPQFTVSSIAPPSRPRACPSFRWPQFTASSSEPSFGLRGIPPFPSSFCPK